MILQRRLRYNFKTLRHWYKKTLTLQIICQTLTNSISGNRRTNNRQVYRVSRHTGSSVYVKHVLQSNLNIYTFYDNGRFEEDHEFLIHVKCILLFFVKQPTKAQKYVLGKHESNINTQTVYTATIQTDFVRIVTITILCHSGQF